MKKNHTKLNIKIENSKTGELIFDISICGENLSVITDDILPTKLFCKKGFSVTLDGRAKDICDKWSDENIGIIDWIEK